MRKWVQRTAAILAAAVIQLYAAVGYYARELPDHYYVGEQQSLQVSTALHIAAQEQPTAAQTLFSETGNEAQTVSLNLFGFIPIKEVEVESIRTPMLVPCGQPFGIKMLMDGVMIVKESGVQTMPACRKATSCTVSTALPSPAIKRCGNKFCSPMGRR